MITIRSNKLVRYQSFNDDAVEGSEWIAKFFRTLNVDDIAKKPGREGDVVTFTLKRLSRQAALRINVSEGDLTAAQQNEIVAVGLKGIEGMPDLVFSLKGSGDRERLDDATLDALYAPSLFYELASVIVRLSGLVPLDGTP